jgi:hypothetical protein
MLRFSLLTLCLALGLSLLQSLAALRDSQFAVSGEGIRVIASDSDHVAWEMARSCHILLLLIVLFSSSLLHNRVNEKR